MQNGGYLPFDEFPMPKLRCCCLYCGGMKMTTEEELEQRVNNLLDDRTKELEAARAAIQKLDLEKLREILDKGGAKD